MNKLKFLSAILLLTFSPYFLSGQEYEAGVYVGSDYSLIGGIGQDYPVIANINLGVRATEKISVIAELTTSPSWLSGYTSYMEFGVGGLFRLHQIERIELWSFGMLIGGMGSYYDRIESESTIVPYFSFGLVPEMEIYENVKLVFRLGYYHTINQKTVNSGLRFGLGMRYFF